MSLRASELDLDLGRIVLAMDSTQPIVLEQCQMLRACLAVVFTWKKVTDLVTKVFEVTFTTSTAHTRGCQNPLGTLFSSLLKSLDCVVVPQNQMFGFFFFLEHPKRSSKISHDLILMSN